MKYKFIQYACKGIICISWIFFSTLPCFSMENDSIGKVIAIRGKAVAISKDSEARTLFLKAPVFLNDTVKTQNGRLQMMFKDNTLVTLGRNSEIQVTQYLWEPGNASSKMETKVEEGSFRVMGGAITRIAPQNFKTDTPSGTIGIRGSMYAGRVDGQSLFVLFQGGKGIYVENEAGMVNITQPGFGTRVENSANPPQEPQKIEPEQQQELELLLTEAPAEEPAEQTGMDSETVVSTDSQTEGTDESSPDGDTAVQTQDTADENTDSVPEDDGGEPLFAENEATLADDTGEESLADSGETTMDTGLTTELSSTADDAAATFSQQQVDEALTPEGTAQEILFLLINDLGFDEVTLSTTRPSSGIWQYKGVMQNQTHPEEANSAMKFIVNWDNSRIIGFEDDSGAFGQGFAFGQVGTNGEIYNMKVLGSDASQGGVMALSGSQTFGNFYGTAQGGLGLAMGGNDYNIIDQTQSEPWSDLVAGTVETKSGPAPTGTETWNGYFVGISEDMTDPATGRRVFFNTSDTAFSLTLNKSAGTFGGSLSGSDFNGSGLSINISGIGGDADDSVYINDKVFAAEIIAGDIDPLATGIKTYGNFLVTANDAMLSSYTTWGYWEVAYEESASPGDDYHLHVPGSRWIAGLKGAVLTPGFTGVYKGGAKGVMYDTSSQMTDLTGGATTLNVNFVSTGNAGNLITGNIYFNETGNLPVSASGPDVQDNRFNGIISTATTSYVNGSFYGPAIVGGSGTGPAAAGGNFNAVMGDGTKYSGIFAGDLQP